MKFEIEGYGVLTGDPAVLNLISQALFKASEMYKLQGADGLAEEASKISDEIYYMLEESGYYGV